MDVWVRGRANENSLERYSIPIYLSWWNGYWNIGIRFSGWRTEEWDPWAYYAGNLIYFQLNEGVLNYLMYIHIPMADSYVVINLQEL